MGRLILHLTMMVAFVAMTSCEKNENEVYYNNSTYAFKQSEIVVNASESDSFSLEVYYIDAPDTELARGKFSFHVDETLSTPEWKDYFENFQTTMVMTEAEDGTFYSDIKIKNDKVIEDNKEIVVYLSTFGGRDSSAEGFDGNAPIYDLTIRLRPCPPVVE